MNESEVEEFDSDALDDSEESSYSGESSSKENKKTKTNKIANENKKIIDKKISNKNDDTENMKLLNRKKVKPVDVIIDCEKYDSSSKSEIIRKSTHLKRRSNTKVDESLICINNKNHGEENSKASIKIKNNKVIDDDENDENSDFENSSFAQGNNLQTYFKKSIDSPKKRKIEEKKSIIDKEVINKIETKETENTNEKNAFLKILGVKSKEMEKTIDKKDDLLKMSLKERLSLKACNGKIDGFLNAIQNFTSSSVLKNNPYAREVSSDDVINELIGKGKNNTDEEEK